MAKKKKSKLSKIIWLLLIILIVILGLFFIFGNKGPKPIIVTVSEVELRDIVQSVSALGRIQPETEVKVSSQTSGEIIFLGVKEGDTVNVGQVLIRIKPDIVEAQLEQQKAGAEASKMEIDVRKAELDRSAANLERIKELYEKEYSSKQDLEQALAAYNSANSAYLAALARYEQALAAFRQVERTAERTTIFSPIKGIVTALNVERGEKVVGTEMMQGTELMRISDLNVMNAIVEVDENDIVMVSLGDTSRIEVDAFSDKYYKGYVYEIGHSAITQGLGTQEQTTNFQVKVRLIDFEPRLRPGMTCNVDIETEKKLSVPSVPLQSVTVRADDLNRTPDVRENPRGIRQSNNGRDRTIRRPPSVVFIKKGDEAKMKKVEIGISDKGFIEITEGLEVGEKVISGPFSAISRELSDGSKIQIDTTSTQGQRRFSEN